MQDINTIFLDEAILIVNDIINEAIEDEHGTYWKTLQKDLVNNHYYYNISENIYIGNSGILLFLIEIYKVTKAPYIYKIILSSAKWLIYYCDNNPTKDYGFYTGRGGTSYVLSKVSGISNESIFLDKAITYMVGCTQKIRYSNLNFDLLAGISGSILSLLHLLNNKKDKRILQEIKQLLNLMINNFQIAKNSGILWNRNCNHIHALCGLSHGAAGISWVLFEVSRYFNSQELEILAHQAYKYEQSFYNSKLKNWPDFRTSFSVKENLEENLTRLTNDSIGFELKPSYMAAWCHGAPGIGLTRLIFNSYKSNSTLENHIYSSITTTLSGAETYDNFSLCHGVFGNLAFVLKAMQTISIKKSIYINLQYKIDEYIERGIATKKINGYYKSGYARKENLKDISLFNGSSGIGYFLLMRHTQSSDLDILCPTLCVRQSRMKLSLNIKLPEIFLNKQFPCTMEVLKQTNKDEYLKLINNISTLDYYGNISKEITKVTKKSILNLVNNINIIKDAFNFDCHKIKHSFPKKGDAYAYLYEVYNQRNNKQLLSTFSISDIFITFNQLYTVVSSKWRWDVPSTSILKSEQIDNRKEKHYYLMYPTINGANVVYLEEFTKAIFDIVRRGNTIQVKDIEKTLLPEDSEKTRNILHSQIYELINANMLIASKFR